MSMLQDPASSARASSEPTEGRQHSQSFLRKGQGLARFSGASPKQPTPRQVRAVSGEASQVVSRPSPLVRASGPPLPTVRESRSAAICQSTPLHHSAAPSAREPPSGGTLLQLGPTASVSGSIRKTGRLVSGHTLPICSTYVQYPIVLINSGAG